MVHVFCKSWSLLFLSLKKCWGFWGVRALLCSMHTGLDFIPSYSTIWPHSSLTALTQPPTVLFLLIYFIFLYPLMWTAQVEIFYCCVRKQEKKKKKKALEMRGSKKASHNKIHMIVIHTVLLVICQLYINIYIFDYSIQGALINSDAVDKIL